jgi:hypothetical protein
MPELTPSNGVRLFPSLLGHHWHALPLVVRAFHDSAADMHATGIASVERGTGWLATVIASVFGFPEADREVSVDVVASASNTQECWVRSFGGKSFSSTLTRGTGDFDHLMCERFGVFEFGVDLVVKEARLYFVVRKWRIFNIPLPTALAPCGNSYECCEAGKFRFNVEITQPFVGMIVRYRGWLEPVDSK